MKAYYHAMALVVLVVAGSSCSRTVDAETAINNIVAFNDPADWLPALAGGKDKLEKYRAAFNLPEVSSQKADEYTTVLGVIAFRCTEWCEWDLAVEYAKAALAARDDPFARRALIRVAIESDNQFARNIVQTIHISDKASLDYIDLLIALGKYGDAMKALDESIKMENTTDYGNSFLSQMHLEKRALEITTRVPSISSFEERLNAAWVKYFKSDEEFQVFCQLCGKGHPGMFEVAFPVRDIAIIAYQKYRGDGNATAAAIWRVRATLLAEAIVAGSPPHLLHYERVIKPKLI